MTTTESGVDLFIAEYDDPSIADRNWDQIKQLAKDDVIDVEGLLLLSRDASGKIKVKDDAHDVKKGAKVGAVAGAVVCLIFPPSIIGGAIVGAAAGGGIGALRSRGRKHDIKEDVEDVLPPNSSGIVVLFRERWVEDVESALADADNLKKHEIDESSAASVKSAVESL